MRRTKKKKNHIFFYDHELKKKLNAIKKSENLTWDELLKKCLKVKDTDELIKLKYDEVEFKLLEKYKNKDLEILMALFWHFTIMSAHGDYDIKRLIYDFENYIRLKTYRKR